MTRRLGRYEIVRSARREDVQEHLGRLIGAFLFWIFADRFSWWIARDPEEAENGLLAWHNEDHNLFFGDDNPESDQWSLEGQARLLARVPS